MTYTGQEIVDLRADLTVWFDTHPETVGPLVIEVSVQADIAAGSRVVSVTS